MRNPKFRLCLWVGLLAFESWFIFFIKKTGWLETVNLWNQIVVFSTAALPLLVAGLILVRKRIRLSSVFIAITLIAGFLAFAMKSAWEASREREYASQLQQKSIIFSTETYLYDIYKDGFGIKRFSVDQEPLPDWVGRIIGQDRAALPTEDQIVALQIKSDNQLPELATAHQRLKNLTGIIFAPTLSNDGLRNHSKALTELNVASICYGHYTSLLHRPDLEWLNGNEHLKSLALLGYEKAPKDIAKLNLPNLVQLTMGVVNVGPFDPEWDTFFNSPIAQQLISLQIVGLRIEEFESEELFSNLKSVEVLTLNETKIDDFSFLTKLPKLESLSIHSKTITEESLETIPKSIPNLYLMVGGRNV